MSHIRLQCLSFEEIMPVKMSLLLMLLAVHLKIQNTCHLPFDVDDEVSPEEEGTVLELFYRNIVVSRTGTCR